MKKVMLAVIFFTQSYLALAKTIQVFPDNQVLPSTQFCYNFRQIEYALQSTLAGDSLLFRQGEYFLQAPLKPVHSGTRKDPVYIGAYNNERVILNGSLLRIDSLTGRPLLTRRDGLVNITGVSHIEVSGLEVMHSANIGISVSGEETTHIILNRCKVHHTYNSGIGLWYCQDVKVLHCEITGANNQDYRTIQPLRREGPHEALTIAGARNFEIAWNHLHQCHKEGIDCKEVSSMGKIHHNLVHDIPRQGIYIDSWFGRLHNIEVYENIVFACEWGIAVSSEGKESKMDSVFIHHNLVFENRASGILIGVWGNDCRRDHIYIHNNTILRNGSPGHWAGKTGGIDIRSLNVYHSSIYNNVCMGNWAFEIASAALPEKADSLFKQQNLRITGNFIHEHEEIQEDERFFTQVYALETKRIGKPLKKPEKFEAIGIRFKF